MPAYSQIQTYVKCNKENFTSELTRFKSVLAQIGFSEKYITDNFSDLEWDICDNGFIYSGCNAKSVVINFFGTMLDITPSVLGWTPQISKDIKEPWLEFELMFVMDDIISFFPTFRIKDEVKIPIWKAMLLFSKCYRETGVYLTDELTDGRPWEALLGCSRDFWIFEAAIIPVEIAKHYKRLPGNFIKKETVGSLFLIDKTIWGEAPW